MGLPQTDDENSYYDPYTYDFWYNITFAIANRYIDRYGARYVKKWRFESWNEPDLRNYNILNFTLSQYLSYIEACEVALRAAFRAGGAQGKLKFGGPAGLFKSIGKHPLCWGSLEMCNLKGRSCPFQYISFHKKGNGSANAVSHDSIQLLNILYSKFPNLKGIPVSNDEADVLSNWSRSLDWRGDVRYAAMIAKIVIDFYKELVVKMEIPVQLLSFDNGFLNYNPYFFTQRTLLARFQMNNTNPTHIQFIRKPAYSVMGLLSLLGDEYLKENVTPPDPFVQFLATRSIRNKNESHLISLLITYVNDEREDKNVKEIRVNFNNLPNNECKYVIYVLDNKITNPFLSWRKHGSPVFPAMKLRNLMRHCEEPYRLEGPRSILNLTLQMNLALPSVALINICSRTSQPLGRVTRLVAHNITRNEVLLVWKDSKIRSKCILTYEVEFRPQVESCNRTKFRRINHRDTIFLSYHHAVEGNNSVEEWTQGWYRVRAVDYWNVPGRYSKVIRYSVK
ncbi:hypothetical protein PPYR_07323 [Photinus pyralis]|uniref:Alpha-L-iduronidase n=3 Tax=Photinus pyralis TaxID=7054 RepID=A0A5N4AQA2_PHOPY|nr:hypothetical protein PPYR_07323 [Photinus pyralis]